MNLFLVGAGPLPEEGRGMTSAAGLRTAQFLTIATSGEGGETVAKKVSLFAVENEKYRGIQIRNDDSLLRHVAVSKSDPHLYRWLREEYKRGKPDAVVGINTFPAYLAAKVVKKGIPFWADLNGWVLAELQAQAFAMDTDAFVAHGKKMEQKILRRADKISVVSTPQKFATYGELAMLDRTLKDNFANPIVEVVENTCRRLSESEKKRVDKLFRGKRVPENAVMVVWLGGFNAWADEETLFFALEKAMEDDHKIHFLATGGVLKGIDEMSFVKFEEQVKQSRLKDRYHLLGWVKPEEVSALLHESDIGLNVDRLCLETETGARNRINEMLRFNLSVITTRGTEIACVLEANGAALGATSGDADDISEKLIRLARDTPLRTKLENAAQSLIKSRFCETMAGRNLQVWLRHPQCAPDYEKRASLLKTNRLQAALIYSRHHGVRAAFAKFRQKLSQIFG